jgi:valyl-tRNA synthetase
MNTEGQDCGQNGGDVTLNAADRWIVSRLQQTELTVIQAIDSYRLDHAAQAIYDFTWNEYCDWYLELSKPVLNDPDSNEEALRGTRSTLVKVLETILRLAHPIIPFITEEIWQRVAPLAGITNDTIMLSPYPEPDPGKIDNAAVEDMQWVMDFILGIRKIRSGYNIKPGQPLPVLLQDGSNADKKCLENYQHYLITLGRIESITWLNTNDQAPESATALVGNMKVLIPMAGLINKEEEKKRLNKEMDKLKANIDRGEAKLTNKKFIDKAPAEVVAKEKSKVAEMQSSLDNLSEQLQRIESM